MWSSRLSSVALILAAIAYLTALAAFFHGILLQSEVAQLLLVQGVLLGGHLLLAMSMGLHARYVLLDAEGALPKRTLKKKAEKKTKKGAEKKTDKADQAAADDVAEKDSASSGRSDAADADGDEEESFDEEVRRYVGGGRPAARQFAARLEARDACGDIGRAAAFAEDRYPRGREFFFRLRFG